MAVKALIIKLGYSETLDPEIGRVPSLGDVLRTTPILSALKERFEDSHITWLVSPQAEPLLNGNKLIDRILIWDEFVPFQLMREKFDILINLEKIPGLCAISDMIDAWAKYGFRFDSVSGSWGAYERGQSFLQYILKKEIDIKYVDYWQKVLVEMVGVDWKGQEYVLGYEPQSETTIDFGFNVEVGPKWQVKSLPRESWLRLEEMLRGAGYSVTWQQGKKNLYEYMDWINSSRILISNDSLGLHIAQAMGKPVVGLFGPTEPSEIFFYGPSKVIRPRADFDCSILPCYSAQCSHTSLCMNNVDPEDIFHAAVESLTQSVRAESEKFKFETEAV